MSSRELIKLTIEEIQKKIASKEISYKELLEAYKTRFEKLSCLNASLSQHWEDAMNQAIELDKNGDKSGAPSLQGIPIAVKDMFLVKGTPTTAGSKILENFIAPYDAFVIQKLKQNKAVFPYKTNLDEFAMGSSNQTSAFGPVVNPWILEDRIARVPGGSSGGSAAAVAANMCVGALGTDTGGSIRQPASFCGIVGFKPTYGRCSRRGVVAFASSFDHPGVFARSVQDASLILEAMAGYDDQEATSLNAHMDKLSALKGNVKGKRIGVAYKKFSHMDEHYKHEFNNLLENLKKEGAILEEVELPSFEDAISLYYILTPAEAASNLARYDGIRYGIRGEGESYEEIMLNTRALFGTEVKRRILLGNYVLLAGEYEKFYGKAVKLRMEMIEQVDQVFQSHDVILLPTTASGAFEIGAQRTAYEMYLEDLYTVIGNIYGGPGIQIPFTFKAVEASEGGKKDSSLDILPSQKQLPIGIQILGARGDERSVIEVAKKMEEIIAWDKQFTGFELNG